MADNDKKDVADAKSADAERLVDELNANLRKLEGMGLMLDRGGLGPGKFKLVDGKLVLTGP